MILLFCSAFRTLSCAVGSSVIPDSRLLRRKIYRSKDGHRIFFLQKFQTEDIVTFNFSACSVVVSPVCISDEDTVIDERQFLFLPVLVTFAAVVFGCFQICVVLFLICFEGVFR